MTAPSTRSVSETPQPRRTVPQPTPESQPFWDGCSRKELVIQRCNGCGRHWFPPSNRCQHCWSDNFEWLAVSGRGEVYTFTVYRRAYASELVDQIPYVVAVVELAEGPRLITNIVGCSPDHVRVGMPVEVTFVDVADSVMLHAFRPRETKATA